MVKNMSVVKLKNLAYDIYVGTEQKRLDGEADEDQNENEETAQVEQSAA